MTEPKKTEAICATALALYLETLRPVLLRDLATACNTTQQTVQDALWARHSDFDRCDAEVWTGSNYGGRYRAVQAIMPSRAHLARLLLAARGLAD